MIRLFEGFGTNSMETDPVDLVARPDVKVANAMMFHNGTSGTIPSQWNNSPFLTGGRLTSAFGSNPRMEKRRVLTFNEFIETSKNSNK